MLILSRKEGQTVNIHTSDGIVAVHFTQQANGQIKLGFEAPASVKIMREEIDFPITAQESKRPQLNLCTLNI